jgi:hypothetical protein
LKKIQFAPLGGILIYLIIVPKYSQIFVKEMLKENNPDVPYLFECSRLEGNIKFDHNIQI